MIPSFIKKSFPVAITPRQSEDTGMAMVLICLLFGFFGKNIIYYPPAIFLLVITMIWPNLYKPLAVVWLTLSTILGTFISKILLSLIFFVLIVPVGMIRRILGYDSLHLKAWKKNNTSVFTVRNHVYSSEDINKPY